MANINLRELAEINGGINVSIYLPTHRNAPENKQDRIRFKNLINKAEKELEDKFEMKNPSSFLKEAENLYQDLIFWTHASDGLALLINEKETLIFKLVGNIPQRLVVGERFHLLPLLNYYEFINESYILDISKDRFKLYFGSQEGVVEVETPGIKQHFDELFDDEDIQNTNYYSERSSKSELDGVETEKYLRYVVKELPEFLVEDAPLLAFGTTEVLSVFHEYSKGRLDILRLIDKPLASLQTNQIYGKLKDILLPQYKEEVENQLLRLNDEVARDRGTDNESLVIHQAPTGRIETLFIAEDMGGLIEEEADKLVQNVLTTDGEVLLIDESITPFPMGVGAIFRY